jgi:hypothetical protein
LEEAAKSTGGGYYTLDDTEAVPRIVDALLEEQASVFKSAPVLKYTDVPGGPFALAVIGFLIVLVVGWRLKL